MRQSAYDQGVRAAEVLLGLLREEPDVNRSVTLPTELVIRQSTAPTRA